MDAHFLFSLICLLGGLLLPIGLAQIARKRNYHVGTSIALGIALALAGLMLPPFFPSPIFRFVFYTISALEYFTFVVGICLPEDVPEDNKGLTLTVPYPPGTRDWGDKRNPSPPRRSDAEHKNQVP